MRWAQDNLENAVRYNLSQNRGKKRKEKEM